MNLADSTEAGSYVTLPSPTRDGYYFVGWYTAATDGNRIGVAEDTYTPDSNVTLYAQWSEISNHEFMDNFDKDTSYQAKYRNYINNDKKLTLVTIGKELVEYGYEPAFIAGFLGHISREGNIPNWIPEAQIRGEYAIT